MNENSDKRVEELMEEFADEMGYDLRDKNSQRRGASSDGKPQRKTLILGGLIILLLIALLALFFKGRTQHSTEDPASIQARLSQLEKRITRLEAMEDKIIFLEKQEKGLQQAITETNEFGRSLTQQLEKLTQRFATLQKSAVSGPAKTKAPRAIGSKPTPLAKKRYHKVLPGESLYRIARRYGISVEELCRLNEITSKTVIQPGQRLLISSGSHQ